MNEHLLRYLNLRVPHDYDTAPLWLFWGLCLVWLMPWSAFLLRAAGAPLQRWIESIAARRRTLNRIFSPYNGDIGGPRLLLILWAALPLLFFSLSTRQEYYVLPALPALAMLIAGWLSLEVTSTPPPAPWPSVSAAVTATPSPSSSPLAQSSPPPASSSCSTPTASVQRRPRHTPQPKPFRLRALARPLPRPHRTRAQPLSLPADPRRNRPFPGGPLAALLLRKQARPNPHAANLALAAGAFTFLLAAHLGLQTFAPVLTSAQLAQAIAPQLQPEDVICIHGEYESASTLAFYLQRPTNFTTDAPWVNPNPGLGPHLFPMHPLCILDGRNANLWYGSFFPDAPRIFETPADLAAQWQGPHRIFLWQSLTDPPNQLPPLPAPVYILVKSGGKEIVSNQPNR